MSTIQDENSAPALMAVTGGCHCGAIGFEARIDPTCVWICHCTDCQTLTGTAYRVTVPALAANFRFTHGAPALYIKVADSGARRAQAFCAQCGTPLYASAPENPPLFNLRAGAIQQRSQLIPRRQIWCQSAQPWAADLRPLPGSPRA